MLRFVRKLLNPLLKLFFNPNPLIQALHRQAQLNVDAAAREAERDRRQAEWNALHYEILQRLVTEVSRVSLESQALSTRLESLDARLDFNDRKVRGLEGTLPQPRPGGRTEGVTASAAPEGNASSDAQADGGALDGARRRRRRRRGRRPGGFPGEAVAVVAEPGVPQTEAGPAVQGDELDGATPSASADAAEPAAKEGASHRLPEATGAANVRTEPVLEGPAESAVSADDGRAGTGRSEP